MTNLNLYLDELVDQGYNITLMKYWIESGLYVHCYYFSYEGCGLQNLDVFPSGCGENSFSHDPYYGYNLYHYIHIMDIMV